MAKAKFVSDRAHLLNDLSQQFVDESKAYVGTWVEGSLNEEGNFVVKRTNTKWGPRWFEKNGKGEILMKDDSTNNLFASMFGDAKEFVKDNRQTLYTVALLFVIDHFVFNGAFRERLKQLMSTAIERAEKNVKGTSNG